MRIITGLNVKGLCQQIKSSQDHITWILDDQVHIIAGRYWAILIEGELPRSVNVSLCSIFGNQPDDGSSLKLVDGVIEKNKRIELIKLFEKASAGKEIEMTNLVQIGESETSRILRDQEKLFFVNEEILRCIDIKKYKGKILASNPSEPILFKELSYLVAPFIKIQKVDFQFVSTILDE